MGALDLRVGVFGLGEAGSSIAADLADAGATVTGFDPAARPALAAVRQVDDPRAAVGDAELVLAITASSDAMTALSQALDTMPAGIVYADLSTASPERKRELAARAAERSLRFADVALMSTVPGKGLFTPALAAGPGAAQYRRLLAPAGVSVDVVGDVPGDAATRKLLRSVVIKGLAALVIESMRAANAAGLAEETWANLAHEFTVMDETFLRRLLAGTQSHAGRRLHEMESTEELLTELGIEPLMTRGIIENLRRVPSQGLPQLPSDDA